MTVCPAQRAALDAKLAQTLEGVPDGPGEARGHPKLVGRSSAASDADTARKLWELSERLTGVTYATPVAA